MVPEAGRRGTGHAQHRRRDDAEPRADGADGVVGEEARRSENLCDERTASTTWWRRIAAWKICYNNNNNNNRQNGSF